MSYPLKSAVAIAIATAAAGLSTAVADQHVGDTYFVPQAGIVGLDNDRNADDAGFVGLAVGRHFSEAVSLELGVSAGDYDYAAGGEPLTLRAYSIDALHIFARDSAVSPYITAGAGFLFTDPGAGDADHHPMAQAGLGLFITLAEKQNGAFKFGIRPEVKARVAMPKRNDPQAKYVDYLAGLGFQFAFGDARPEPPPPAPPPPPPPAWPKAGLPIIRAAQSTGAANQNRFFIVPTPILYGSKLRSTQRRPCVAPTLARRLTPVDNPVCVWER
jgi:OOP family OmpA-OmpF porin